MADRVVSRPRMVSTSISLTCKTTTKHVYINHNTFIMVKIHKNMEVVVATYTCGRGLPVPRHVLPYN